jgi:hypothetical protein
VYIHTSFLGRSRFVQADINNNTGDVNRPYRWSATDLWVEEISRDLLRFGFLIFLVIGGQGCPQILVICIGWEGWFFPQNF